MPLKQYGDLLAAYLRPQWSRVMLLAALMLGSIGHSRGRLDDAVQEFQMSLKLNPLNANAHNSLGVVFALQGHLDEAIREFKAALEIEPAHINAQNNLRKSYPKLDK
jgi:Flp pilus assembly protein TadD